MELVSDGPGEELQEMQGALWMWVARELDQGVPPGGEGDGDLG